MMVDKLFIKPQSLLDDSFALGKQVLDDGFSPKMIIALWRGGTPIGIAMHEYLEHFAQISIDHVAIRTTSYQGMDLRGDQVDIYGLSYVLEKIHPDEPILIVDDVFDSGFTIQAVLEQLRARGKCNTPKDIRVAVPWYKPSSNMTNREPDYFLHTTDKWLVFPYELEGLDMAEIERNKPELFEVLKQIAVE